MRNSCSDVSNKQSDQPWTWTRFEAAKLCEQIEAVCPKFGCHVALTGGCLYKSGERKDCDILFYRIRQVPAIDMDGLIDALMHKVGLEYQSGCGWCYKFRHLATERNVDAFFPEEQGGPQYGDPELTLEL